MSDAKRTRNKINCLNGKRISDEGDTFRMRIKSTNVSRLQDINCLENTPINVQILAQESVFKIQLLIKPHHENLLGMEGIKEKLTIEMKTADQHQNDMIITELLKENYVLFPIPGKKVDFRVINIYQCPDGKQIVNVILY